MAFYLGKSSNLGERQFNHVLPESSIVAFFFFFFLSVTDTSLVQVLQGAHHTMSQRQVRMRRSQDLLTRKYGISFPTGFLLTSPATIKMSSMPYFTLDILRAIRRRMTAIIDMVQTTEMDAAASAHRLSLSEGTSLTQSCGIIAKVSNFFLSNQFKCSASHVGDAKRIVVRSSSSSSSSSYIVRPCQ